MKVVFTSLALAGLEEIRTLLIARSPRGAAKVAERIRQIVRMISEQPYGSQEVAERTGIRAPLVAFPYVIYYRVGATQVEIPRIQHGARRPLEG